MANNILITPGSASIGFSGSAANSIRLQVEPSGSIAFYGASGSLFGISDSLSGSLMSVNDISGLPILEVFSDDRVVAGTFNTNAFVITGSRLGLGTATPSTKLHLYDTSANNPTLKIENANTYLLNVGLSGNTGSIGSSNATPLSLVTNGLNRIWMDTTGRVGIGTINPSTHLEVSGSITTLSPGDSYITVRSSAGDGTNAAFEVRGGASNANWLIGTNRSTIFGAADSLGFYKNAGTTGTKMVITDGGSVGIGVTSPTALAGRGTNAVALQIAASGSAGLRFWNQSNVVGNFDIGVSGSQAFIGAYYSQVTDIVYDAYTQHILLIGNAERLRLTNTALTMITSSLTTTVSSSGWSIIGQNADARIGMFHYAGTAGSQLQSSTNGGGAYLPLYINAKNIDFGISNVIKLSLDTAGSAIFAGAASFASAIYGVSDNIFTSSINNTVTYLTLQNTNTGNAATGRLTIGNNASVVASTYTMFGSNHATLPNRMQLMNQMNGVTSLGANGSEVMYITGSGNVGIGTSSPGYSLQVNGRGYFFATNQDAGWGMLTLDYGNGTNSDIYGIQFKEGGTVNAAIGFASYASSNMGDLKFYVNNSSSLTTAMTISGSGKVGIGTTTPAASLHVYGSNTQSIQITNISAGSTIAPQLTQLNFNGYLNEARARIEATDVAATTNGSELRFYTADVSNVIVQRMSLDRSGALLITGSLSARSLSNTSYGVVDVRNDSDPTLQMVMFGSAQTGTTFGKSNSGSAFIYTTTYATVQPTLFGIGSVGSTPVIIGTNNVERIRIGTDGVFTVSGSSKVQQTFEKVVTIASAPPATVNFDVTSGSVLYYTTNANANWTLNFRGNASQTLNSLMEIGQSIVCTLIVPTGATPYSASAFQVDTGAVTPKWLGGTYTADASSTTVNTCTLIKTADATFTVLGSQVRYT